MISENDQVATMSFFRFEGFVNRRWAMKQMYESRAKLRKIKGVQFFKLLGTGGKDGYSIMPDFGVYAVFVVWENFGIARRIKETDVFMDYHGHSMEHITFYLSPVSSRGSWSGFSNWRLNQPDPDILQICALTRAAIKFNYMPKFWGMVPQISKEHVEAKGKLFSKGVGEYPILEQATFTIWKNKEYMDNFARRNSHLEAIKVTRERKGFREEMFTRFQPFMTEGAWSGFNL